MFKRSIFYFLSIMSGLLFLGATAYAVSTTNNNTSLQTPQSSNYKNDWWFNFGVGQGAAKHIDGFAGEISANYMPTNNGLFTLRTAGVTDTWGAMGATAGCALGSFGLMPCDVNEGYVYDISPLYGYIYKQDHWYVSGSAGVGYVGMRDTTLNSRSPHFRTVGLPVEIQTFYTPFAFGGIGLIAIANANSKNSYAALLLALQFGDLR